MRDMRSPSLGLKLGILISLSTCKTVEPTTSSIKHEFGRTYIRPEEKMEDCRDGRDFPEAVAYLKSLGHIIMTRNETTFGYDFAPEKFCFEVVDLPGLNASSDPGSRKITIRADLLRLGAEGDAPIAAIIAHELAHVTMQHRRREPVAADLPPDIDLQELNRRRQAQKIWQEKISASRRSLVDNAIHSKFFDGASKLLHDQTFWDRILTALGDVDRENYHRYVADMKGLATDFAQAISNPALDPYQTWRLIDLMSLYLDDIGSSAPNLKRFMTADPRDCNVLQLCDEANLLQVVGTYLTDVAKPAMNNICTIKLEQSDDPQFYAPWVQWMEQQADEVGLEFYLRAQFLPGKYTTFVETMLKADDQFKTCLENIKKPGWTAPRVTDEFVEGHPPKCFRYANINFRELLEHERDYASLLPKAILDEIPELAPMRTAAISSVKDSR